MNRIFLIFGSLIVSATSLTAQEQQASESKPYVLTLEDVIEIAKSQSPQAIQARHSFRASYFSFISYKATFLPKLTLTTQPTTWDKSITTVPSVNNDGDVTYKEARANTFTSTAGLALSQNIGFTGGNISLGSDFQRRQSFLEKNSDVATQFTTNPIRLSIIQPLNGYNRFRWEKQIEPLRYEEARQSYIVAMEQVAERAVNNFFSYATDQVTLKMRQTNLENQTALFEIAKGRYELGGIAEDALLQVELRLMQNQSSLNSARISLESSKSQLRSFLGFRDDVEIEVLINPTIPSFIVDYEEAMNYAMTRNPDIISYNRQILEAERLVAQAKSQTGITMDLNASFGTNKTGYTFNEAYSPTFGDREGVGLRITIPILDWSQTRNTYRNAQSSLEVAEARVQQQETEFKQDVFLQVMNFNIQEDQLRIAAKTDTIAQKGYEIAYQRYIMGKGNVTDLGIADTEKDNAIIGFMNALRSYWRLYYTVRRITLFDFLANKPIEEDFDRLIGD